MVVPELLWLNLQNLSLVEVEGPFVSVYDMTTASERNILPCGQTTVNKKSADSLFNPHK